MRGNWRRGWEIRFEMLAIHDGFEAYDQAP